MASESSDGVLDSWSSFFHEILRPLEEGERQLDLANVSYIAYVGEVGVTVFPRIHRALE